MRASAWRPCLQGLHEAWSPCLQGLHDRCQHRRRVLGRRQIRRRTWNEAGGGPFCLILPVEYHRASSCAGYNAASDGRRHCRRSSSWQLRNEGKALLQKTHAGGGKGSRLLCRHAPHAKRIRLRQQHSKATVPMQSKLQCLQVAGRQCLWCSAHHAVNELLQVVLVQVIPKQIHCAHVQRLQRGLGLSLQRSAQMQQKESKNVSVGQLVREAGVHASTA